MTKLEYINDTYLFKINTKILEIWNNDFWEYIILGKTIFYPQWWWQPSDIWIIKNNNWEFQVENVRFDENKKNVFHYGNILSWSLNENEEVILNIDEKKRIQNSKNHSAGHLIDVAVKNIWLNNIKAIKWFHFPQGCYLEYKWILEWEKKDIIDKLNIELTNLIFQKLNIIIGNKDFLFRQISFQWFEWCGCWGTHVNNSSEIWEIVVNKIKVKKDIIKVSYNLI